MNLLKYISDGSYVRYRKDEKLIEISDNDELDAIYLDLREAEKLRDFLNEVLKQG